MEFNELIQNINKSADELDFISARKFIEENLSILLDQKHLLNSNSRDLLNFIIQSKESGAEPLKRQELGIINALNTYASKFDLRGLKLTVKENATLLLRTDIVQYLNSDAKIILQGMGAINKGN
ncbi:hypothetical protein [Bacillus sp. T33-2]|uniref:hypothetical protein n=1 Tax=Bacillus sp. T33-2 TaxID=2054168 RepID=UPI000C78D7FE|nr:hypothetical protein [Bacillus sp. T33-2]PLR94824.1 hypothetical protein CVD19_16255 [Bacillus sp. T33-2]